MTFYMFGVLISLCIFQVLYTSIPIYEAFRVIPTGGFSRFSMKVLVFKNRYYQADLVSDFERLLAWS